MDRKVGLEVRALVPRRLHNAVKPKILDVMRCFESMVALWVGGHSVRPRHALLCSLGCGLVLISSACQYTECAEGLVSKDGRCGRPGGDCGPCGVHEICDTSATPDACRCGPGYEGNPCTFAALIIDPELRRLEDPDTGKPYWVDEGGKGARLLPLEPGSGEGKLGVGLLAASVICNGGSLTQVVTMPSYEIANEPYVVEVTYQTEDVDGLGIGFDRAWKRLPPTGGSWQPETFCLGEGAFGVEPNGSDVHVRISASERPPGCLGTDPAGSIRVDRFTIRPAIQAECGGLEFGQVLNGAAGPNGGGWRFLTENGIDGAVAPNLGREGSSGARLFRDVGINGRATMTTKMSVPLPASTPSPALRFWWRGSSRQLFEIEAGTRLDLDDRGRHVDTLIGSNAGLNQIYCLPPWTHGSVLDLSFSLTEGDVSEATELVIDDVEIVSDPGCGSDEDLLDPGFEAVSNRWFGASISSIDEAIRIQTNGVSPRNGSGVLELTYARSDADLTMEAFVFVPESEGERGPALTFYSMSPTSPTANIRWVLGPSEAVGGDVHTTSSWQANEACLPSQWAGRWFRFQVGAYADASPGGPIAQEHVFLDDFSLSPSSDCPAQGAR